jgi:hypothetical protein
MELNRLGFWFWGSWYLKSLSTIFQLYRGGKFYWWRKPHNIVFIGGKFKSYPYMFISSLDQQ